MILRIRQFRRLDDAMKPRMAWAAGAAIAVSF